MRDRLLIRRAKELRASLSQAERRLWYFLRRNNLGCRFRRQYPIGPYIADFACVDPRVVIEVDGGQHAEQSKYDESRDRFMRDRGFIVLRFWSNDVLQNTEGVLEVILRAVQEKKVPPSCPCMLQGSGHEIQERLC
jgi:very-short-patch-repair endonuclease